MQRGDRREGGKWSQADGMGGQESPDFVVKHHQDAHRNAKGNAAAKGSRGAREVMFHGYNYSTMPPPPPHKTKNQNPSSFRNFSRT